jgi:hypothetical protein
MHQISEHCTAGIVTVSAPTRVLHVTTPSAADMIRRDGFVPAPSSFGSAIYLLTNDAADAIRFYTEFRLVPADGRVAVVAAVVAPHRQLLVEVCDEFAQLEGHEAVVETVAAAVGTIVGAGSCADPARAAAAAGFMLAVRQRYGFVSDVGGAQLAVTDPSQITVSDVWLATVDDTGAYVTDTGTDLFDRCAAWLSAL